MAKNASTMRTLNDPAGGDSTPVTVEALIDSYHFTDNMVTCQTYLDSYWESSMHLAVDDRAFELVGGHPAIDLVNTLDWRFRENGPEELLASYSDLLRFAEQSDLLTPKQLRQITRTGPD